MSKKKKTKKPSLAKKPQGQKVAAKATTDAKQRPTAKKASATAKPATVRKKTATAPERELTFGRDSFLWMGIGAGLVLIGLLLMTGGGMPGPDVWDESIIYSFRRITLAPIVILGGIGTVIYAILKK